MFEKNDTIITAVKNTLRKRFEDKFFYEIRNSSKLGLYNCIKESLQQNDTLVKSAIIDIDQLLQNLEFQRTPFLIGKGRWSFIPSSKRYCPLCVGNHIGDEKHYILHSTNINFIKPRKSFLLTKLYRINTNNSLIKSSPLQRRNSMDTIRKIGEGNE